jgi:hypothetical protein
MAAKGAPNGPLRAAWGKGHRGVGNWLRGLDRGRVLPAKIFVTTSRLRGNKQAAKPGMTQERIGSPWVRFEASGYPPPPAFP